MPDVAAIQTLVDTQHRAVLVLTNKSDGTGESAVVKANSHTLAYVQTVVHVSHTSGRKFKVGEAVTSNAGGTAIVHDLWRSNTSSLYVLLGSANGAFSNGHTITGGDSNVVLTQTGTSERNPVVAISSIQFSVPTGTVELAWQGDGGGANTKTALVIGGSGRFDLRNEVGLIPNHATSNTGALLLTTRGVTANNGYTIILELKKVSGFGTPNFDRNQDYV